MKSSLKNTGSFEYYTVPLQLKKMSKVPYHLRRGLQQDEENGYPTLRDSYKVKNANRRVRKTMSYNLSAVDGKAFYDTDNLDRLVKRQECKLQYTEKQ